MRRPYWFGVGLSLALFVVDRVTRTLAFHAPPHDLIPHVLTSVPTTNTGIAFGLELPGPLLIFVLVVLLAVVAGLAFAAYRNGQVVRWTAALAIGAGALANLLDRLTYGYVRDFLKISFWPTTGNLGDWLITLGVVVLILARLRKGSEFIREPL